MRIVHLTIACAALLLACSQTRAAMIYRYTFHFDALTANIGGNEVNYAAAEFSVESPTILGLHDSTTTVLPPGDLNGYSVPGVFVLFGDPTFLGFEQTGLPNLSGNVGDVVGFYMSIDGPPNVPGFYPSINFAGRLIIEVPNSSIPFYYTNGSLTIEAREVAGEVPEPASMALFGTGLAGIGLFSRRRRRRTARCDDVGV